MSNPARLLARLPADPPAMRRRIRFGAMPYAGSYLQRLRERVGHELVLMPGAMIAVQREDDQVLFTRRGGRHVVPSRRRRRAR